jgi:hypothetical protein
MFVPHRRQRPPHSDTEIALLFLDVDDVRTSQKTQAPQSVRRIALSFRSFLFIEFVSIKSVSYL